jgi:carbon starvation protein
MMNLKKCVAAIFWILLALAGAWAYVTLAFRRGEPINSGHILIAAICTYAIGFRFYSTWIAARMLALNDRRATPCVVHDDGRDFVKTNRFIVFGHHFAAIAGPGPLVGPVLAAQFGYLPGALWILIGAVLGGTVQDFVILLCSIRRDGKSLAQMVKEELNSLAGFIAMLAILAILIIMLAVLALVVVKVLAESPWGIFTVGATVPIALLMGCYLRFVRVGKVLEASAFGITLLLLAVWGGKLIYSGFQVPEIVMRPLAAIQALLSSEPLSNMSNQLLMLKAITVAWVIIAYGVISSSLPVWLLLAPRDYLSTFMKLGTIFALACGISLMLPNLQLPALTQFTDGSGLVVAGKIFPFCFITIACGAISGFHTLIASGTTPKMITREGYARHIGYGAMCCESFVAIMALIAACALDPGVYFSMNIKGDPAVTVAQVSALGFPVTTDHMNSLAGQLGEKTLFGRTGGAATLAVGMAQIFSGATNGRWLDLWYHFAIMFEALFILTTVDAGTRVGRYLIQSILGRVWKPLGDRRNYHVVPIAAALMVGAWGYFLIQGVRDPLGGINSLWPLFGIANQMLAAIALCLATTIILKMQLCEPKAEGRGSGAGRPALALITFVPLIWLVAVTFTAGVQKIWHPDLRIGFLAQAHSLAGKSPDLQKALENARSAGDAIAIDTAQKALQTNDTLQFNNVLDAVMAGTFLVLVAAIIFLSVREWVLLLTRRKPAVLHETEPVWLSDYALKESGPNLSTAAGAAAIALALARELSGEAPLERAQQQAQTVCQCHAANAQEIYVEAMEQRFNGVRRCC